MKTPLRYQFPFLCVTAFLICSMRAASRFAFILILCGMVSPRLLGQIPPPGLTNLIRSDFDIVAAGRDGWTAKNDHSGNETLTYFSTNGSSGGYVSWGEGQSDGARTYFVAPAKFLGDRHAAYNGLLAFSLRRNGTNGTVVAFDDIFLASSNLLLALIFPTNPPAGVWTPYEIPLNENVGWINRTSQRLATKEDMRAVLKDITRLWIRAEYISGGDTCGLDAVAIHARLPGPVQPVLAGNFFMAIYVTGDVGREYRVEYRNAFDPTNSWQKLADVVISANPHLLIDEASTLLGTRFYRAVLNE